MVGAHEIAVNAFCTSGLSAAVALFWVQFVGDIHTFVDRHPNVAIVMAIMGFGGIVGMILSAVGMIWL